MIQEFGDEGEVDSVELQMVAMHPEPEAEGFREVGARLPYSSSES